MMFAVFAYNVGVASRQKSIETYVPSIVGDVDAFYTDGPEPPG